jgi:4-amino-4-deoxy-L-arabinose transferase-like glycosyltransferase
LLLFCADALSVVIKKEIKSRVIQFSVKGSLIYFMILFFMFVIYSRNANVHKMLPPSFALMIILYIRFY